jgi:hypothetical protein
VRSRIEVAGYPKTEKAVKQRFLNQKLGKRISRKAELQRAKLEIKKSRSPDVEKSRG